MTIELQNIKPCYISEGYLKPSEIFLQPSIKLQAPKKYLLVAPSGKGKTSLLNFIYGANFNFSGKILYDEQELSHKQVYALRNRKLSYVFQDLKVFDNLSLWENLKLLHRRFSKLSENDLKQMLRALNLDHLANHKAKFLSMGQKQRLAIIRALAVPFKFILLDEPFSHLDSDITLKAVELIEQYAQLNQAGIIITALQPVDFMRFDQVFNI